MTRQREGPETLWCHIEGGVLTAGVVCIASHPPADEHNWHADIVMPRPGLHEKPDGEATLSALT